MILTITEVTQDFAKDGAEYRKIKGTTLDGKETTKIIFDNLQEKWELLEEGTTLEFKMVKKGQFWNVADITTPSGGTPKPTAPATLEKPRPGPRLAKLGDNKNKAFALSYAKDLAVAGVIEKMQILTWAELFDRWLNGDVGIPDEIVTELFGKYVKAQSKKEEK